MKRKLIGVLAGLILFGITGSAHAALMHMGFIGESMTDVEYDLWYDDVNLVAYVKAGGMNYSGAQATRDELNGFATTLYHFDSGLNISWLEAWAIPSAADLRSLFGQPSGTTDAAFDRDVYWTRDSETFMGITEYYVVFYPGGAGRYGTAYNSYWGTAVRRFEFSTVPLPSAVWLLGSGLACFGMIRRKTGRRH